jgi:hypothetical protein
MPTLAAIAATGVSWQALAPTLWTAVMPPYAGYLRSASAATDQPGATRDAHVQVERAAHIKQETSRPFAWYGATAPLGAG